MASKKASTKKVSSSRTARGAAVERQNAGGTPVGAVGVSPEEHATQDRLAQQREVAAEREEAAALTQEAASRAMPTEEAQVSGIFTAVVRNGLSHRRNGIIFGDEPTTVDISGWTDAQKQNFFNDSFLMIVPGRQLNAMGALLAPGRSFPPNMTGGAGENATPEMLAALDRGRAMAHPSSGAAIPVTAARATPPAVRELEQKLNEK